MKYLIATFLLLLGFSAYAGNGYCDSRPSPNDRQRCYNLNIGMQNNVLDQTRRKFLTDPKVPEQEKQALRDFDQQWVRDVNASCRTSVCTYDAIVRYNSQVIAVHRKYNANP